jgi:tRNA threonylcarbamoyladenosine biosynthesis protein TsaB
VSVADHEYPWILGIDTSSDVVSLALVPTAPDSVAGGELSWMAARNHTATLLAQIDRLVRLCGIESDALGGVAVTIGPGGFNALRVGMSVAKGFAFALSVPIFGAGTLDLAVHGFSSWGLPVRAFVPAGRGRVVFADYSLAGGRLYRQGEMAHRAPIDLAADLLSPTLLIGDLTTEDEVALRAQPHVVLPGRGLRRRRAAVLVDMIMPRWVAGESDDLTELEPLYIHRQPKGAGRTDTGSGV